jgi:hypothetical protein
VESVPGARSGIDIDIDIDIDIGIGLCLCTIAHASSGVPESAVR